MGIPLLLSLLCAAWLIHGLRRPWVTVQASISGRSVSTYIQSDEDNYYEYFPASFGYVYTFGGREFSSSFDDENVDDSSFWKTDSFAEAVVEAKRRQVGETFSIQVDSAHPEIATLKTPRYQLPLVGIVVYLGILLWQACKGRRGDAMTGCLTSLLVVPVTLLWIWNLRIPAAEEIDAGYSPSPYLAMMTPYPSLGYVPQNQLKKFESLEALLKAWGRPDELWIESTSSGPQLTLTYRHGLDWSQAWSVDFGLSRDGSGPVPLGAPRKDDPKR